MNLFKHYCESGPRSGGAILGAGVAGSVKANSPKSSFLIVCAWIKSCWIILNFSFIEAVVISSFKESFLSFFAYQIALFISSSSEVTNGVWNDSSGAGNASACTSAP